MLAERFQRFAVGTSDGSYVISAARRAPIGPVAGAAWSAPEVEAFASLSHAPPGWYSRVALAAAAPAKTAPMATATVSECPANHADVLRRSPASKIQVRSANAT
jgi:hypothetical protein